MNNQLNLFGDVVENEKNDKELELAKKEIQETASGFNSNPRYCY